MSTTQTIPPPAELVDSSATPFETQERTPSEPMQRPIAKPPLVDKQSRIIWGYVLGVGLLHALIPLAFFSYFFSWWGLLWIPVGNYLFCSLGIGAGLHRLHTHRGYKCHLWFEHFLAIIGLCNLQQSVARWVLVHRLHHQHSDHELDPHTPLVTWFWGHMGWLFIENRQLSNADTYDKYARDILRDPFYMRLERHLLYVWVYIFQAVLFLAAGLLVGYLMYGTWYGTYRVGVLWVLWGVAYRTVYTWHVTWAVNSFAHMWGYRNYDTRENSRNNLFCGLITHGDGWHNNHHADPRSAAHGHHWWEPDFTFLAIRLWEKLGLVWDVVPPNQSLLELRTKPR